MMQKNSVGVGVAVILAARLVAGSAGVAGTQDERVLTVEQTTMQNVQAPTGTPTAYPLGVTAWVDRPDNTYAAGEHVRLFVQTNKDAYVTVLNVAPSGETTVLFPNRFRADNQVRANTVTEIPDPEGRARITVAGASGAELIKVVASTAQAPLFEAAQLGRAGPFPTVRMSVDEAARTLQVVMADETEAEWDVYGKVIRTIPAHPAASAAPVQAPVAGTVWPSQPFGLQVAADRPVYHPTEPVTLMVKAAVDCHLTLLNTGPGGASRLLFPNRYQRQTLIRAGQTVVVPGIGAGVSIRPIGPTGVENVVAVCSEGTQPALGAPGDFPADAFPALEDAAMTARALAVVADQITAQTAVASASFVVVP